MDELTHLLAKIELVADDIIDSKTQIVHLDIKRQKNREALNNLREQQQTNYKNKTEVAASGKNWICVGNMFIKLSANVTKNLISDDQVQLNSGIDKLHEQIKQNVAKLRDLEGKPQLTAFNLKPLKKEEILALRTAFKV